MHPLYLVSFVSEIRGAPNCLYFKVYYLSLAVFAGLSATNLLTLNIERYLSIVHPVFNRNRITKRRCVAVLTVLASFYLLSILLRILWPNILVVWTVVSFTICLVTCFLYASIFYTARRVLTPRERNPTEGKEQQTKPIEERKNTATFLRDLKLVKMCLLVVFCCFVCYLPASVGLLIRMAGITSSDKLNHARLWSSTLLSMNSTLNCLIFFWSEREFRKEWKKAINLK